MTKRTFSIIMACKNAEHGDAVDAAREYMAKECNCPIETYTQFVMSNIMESAMYDYIDTCDKPSTFLRFFHEWGSFYSNVSLGAKIAIAFQNVQVKRDGKCINGFGEWMKEDSDEVV